ncbi:DUF6048 family protein [Maribacter sp. HTCC2170]|uniref:DUF6048 family protein n=1 Tax=Maribacter sp. (strain HTCC2170 / KCCM 42371) TaxID=313603 RepID=UPI00006B4935|nr:DUF6048 family protein [Maribacter sp. HTCC2170]EAR00917.1 hypothetical protein FB2170_09106 [Maribacter sp. HTCC2170]
MLRYSISILLLLCVFSGWAQDETIDLQPQDTVIHKQTYGLRVGVDLSRIIISQTSDDYSGIELAGDYRLTKKLYIAAELGNEKKTKQENLFNFTSSGSYLKLGVDYNTYENWYGMNNTIFIGGRYAVSSFSQTLNNFQYFDTNRYWSPDGFPNGSSEPIEYDGRSKSWIEAVLGIKAELFANIYLGGSIRFGFMLSDPKDEPFPNPFVPGFNKVTDGSKFGVGYNYSLTYMIPLYKKANKKKEVESEAEIEQ